MTTSEHVVKETCPLFQFNLTLYKSVAYFHLCFENRSNDYITQFSIFLLVLLCHLSLTVKNYWRFSELYKYKNSEKQLVNKGKRPHKLSRMKWRIKLTSIIIQSKELKIQLKNYTFIVNNAADAERSNVWYYTRAEIVTN